MLSSVIVDLWDEHGINFSGETCGIYLRMSELRALLVRLVEQHEAHAGSGVRREWYLIIWPC